MFYSIKIIEMRLTRNRSKISSGNPETAMDLTQLYGKE